jgi:HEPN domain-containing protein
VRKSFGGIGATVVNRMQLQQLAADRIIDAQTLLAAGRWSGAYYLAGYAVECGLKSCVLAFVERTGVIFLERKFQDHCWTHELEMLLKTAGLEPEFGQARGRNPALAGYWGVVKDWKETSRYEQKTQSEAEQLYEAIIQNPDGILPWIQTRW